jgi:hypothetical protein
VTRNASARPPTNDTCYAASYAAGNIQGNIKQPESVVSIQAASDLFHAKDIVRQLKRV